MPLDQTVLRGEEKQCQRQEAENLEAGPSRFAEVAPDQFVEGGHRDEEEPPTHRQLGPTLACQVKGFAQHQLQHGLAHEQTTEQGRRKEDRKSVV